MVHNLPPVDQALFELSTGLQLTGTRATEAKGP
jgi:hypothetical protein